MVQLKVRSNELILGGCLHVTQNIIPASVIGTSFLSQCHVTCMVLRGIIIGTMYKGSWFRYNFVIIGPVKTVNMVCCTITGDTFSTSISVNIHHWG